MKDQFYFSNPIAGWLLINFLQMKFTHISRYGRVIIQLIHENNRVIYKGKTARFDILQADPSNMEITNRKNFWTNSVQFEKKGVKNYSFLTILYPQKTESLLSPEIRLFERDGNKQIVLFADSLKFITYLINQPSIKLDEFETDAELIATTFINDTLKTILIKDGTYFTSDGIKIKSKDKISIEVEISEDNQIKYIISR